MNLSANLWQRNIHRLLGLSMLAHQDLSTIPCIPGYSHVLGCCDWGVRLSDRGQAQCQLKGWDNNGILSWSWRRGEWALITSGEYRKAPGAGAEDSTQHYWGLPYVGKVCVGGGGYRATDNTTVLTTSYRSLTKHDLYTYKYSCVPDLH